VLDQLRVPAQSIATAASIDTVESIDVLEAPRSAWPRRCDLFGVRVSATTYDEVCESIVGAVRAEEPAVVSFHAVHAIVTSSTDRELLRKVNNFDIIAPDGQPVRWALNRLYGARLPDRVCGPELMLRLCARAAAEGISIYLYGSSPEIINALIANLTQRYGGLIIAGAESPPFRKLSVEEDAEMVRRINDSGAGIVFIGLGCPKQDHFAADHRDRIRGVQVCVGAAFDFHAGHKKVAPAWMQRGGLEWVYRLVQEPRRLWRRYLVTNTLFIQKFVLQWGSMWLRGIPSANQN
jgi:exopolysaccharide biosynthesis WecB/TagA/CpsF family protein